MSVFRDLIFGRREAPKSTDSPPRKGSFMDELTGRSDYQKQLGKQRRELKDQYFQQKRQLGRQWQQAERDLKRNLSSGLEAQRRKMYRAYGVNNYGEDYEKKVWSQFEKNKRQAFRDLQANKNKQARDMTKGLSRSSRRP